jgi:hypothetical protein
VEAAVHLAAAEFNKGAQATGDTLKEMGIEPGAFFQLASSRADSRRLKQSVRRSREGVRERRQKAAVTKAKVEGSLHRRESLTYGPGAFDAEV